MNKDKVINNIKSIIADLNIFKWEVESDIEAVKNNRELSIEEINIVIEKGSKDIEAINYGLSLLKKIVCGG